MKEYIDKAAVKAEIERQMQEYQSTGDDYWFPVIENQKNILSFLNTLEVKEVGEPSNDLEEEIELVKGDYEQVNVAWNNDFDFIARHFYELGLKEQLKNK